MAAPGLPVYETIYGVPLLDDIHNYFPALLYEHSRFQNITQVFSYVRHQLNNRFNLYAYGARRANLSEQEEITPTPSPTPVQPPSRPVVTPDTRYTDRMLNTMVLDLLSLGLQNAEDATTTPNLFFTTNTATGTRTPAQLWTAFRQPVVVRPSSDTIQRATSVVAGTLVPAGTNCAICQEAIAQTDTARKINHCDHYYHQICIDQWFQRSVFCPTCRFDIRESLRNRLA